MKKLLITSLCALATSASFASPIDPMDYYTPDNVDQQTADYIWENMTEDLDGKHCFKRAQVWVVGMRDMRRRLVKSKKIFIHYTDKFNSMLDEIEDDEDVWGKKKIENKYGERVLNSDEIQLYDSNLTWDYHVAPVIEVNGVDVVLDKNLPLPYDMPMPYAATPDYKLEMKVKRSSPEEWLEALTYRGEMLWNIKRKVMEAHLPQLEEDLRSKSKSTRKKAWEKINRIKAEQKALGMDKNDSIDIKCTKVTSMAEVDAQQNTAWCFYSIVPMYYYNEIDLRQVAYGDAQYDFRWAVPKSANNAVNNEAGKNYIRSNFRNSDLKYSLGEINDKDTRAYYEALYKWHKEKEE